ncbi:hypothetical protein D3C73_708580 [compost metagenome]
MDIEAVCGFVLLRQNEAQIRPPFHADIDQFSGFIRIDEIVQIRLNRNAVMAIKHGELLMRPGSEIGIQLCIRPAGKRLKHPVGQDEIVYPASIFR